MFPHQAVLGMVKLESIHVMLVTSYWDIRKDSVWILVPGLVPRPLVRFMVRQRVLIDFVQKFCGIVFSLFRNSVASCFLCF